MRLSDKYRFYLDIPTVGLQEAFPITDALNWRYVKKPFPRKELQSTLTFYDKTTDGIEDFKPLYELERAKRRCDRVRCIVEKTCEAGTTEFWQGFFYTPDGDWDVSGCSVTVKLTTNDPYQCIIDNWKKSLNILDYGEPTVIRDIYGSVQYLQCTDTKTRSGRISPRSPEGREFFALNCFQGSATLCERVVFISTSDGNSERVYFGPRGDPRSTGGGGERTYEITEYYVREFVEQVDQPPGIGWVSVSDEYGTGWARPLETILVPDDQGNLVCDVAVLGEIPNAIYLPQMFENWILEHCPELNVVSNFFNINPDGSNPENDYYTAAEMWLKDLYLIPKSEILYLGASDRATGTPGVTFEKIYQDLQNMFDIDLRIEEGILRLEHQSYFRGKRMLNLRQEIFDFNMRGNFKYRYINSEIPSSEKWVAADITDVTGDFDYSTLEFDPCSSFSAGEKTYTNNVTTTNIAGIIKSGKLDDGNVSPDGLCLVTTAGKVIMQDVGKISGRSKANAHLSWGILIDTYKSYLRPLKLGKFNGEYLEFARAFPTRRVVNEICLNCEDIDLFNPDDLVNTCLWWGEVEEATYTDPGSNLQITTLHD